jgi:hypothetical protein
MTEPFNVRNVGGKSRDVGLQHDVNEDRQHVIRSCKGQPTAP